MSIAVLSQVYTEARRLMIAGSVVARGDFRLKKLLPSLQQAGKQAPVFAKVAEAVGAVLEGPEETAPASLLELTSLVNAVLYTQGETGIAGKLDPVETTDLGGTLAQTSARVLKPLLEALSSTGSGRLELVKEAEERGHFRDLRLVKPALAALDDPYPEIAELIAKKVLPLYGKAILPELRAKYDPKGTKGHPRRLTLLHTIDPSGSRELVQAALEGGSKEVKVAAIACLGEGPEDLAFLIEQASAKAQDVRAAAYRALAKLDHPDAIAVLTKAVGSKDYEFAGSAIGQSHTPKLVDVLVAEIRNVVNSLPTVKEKKKVSEGVQRILSLLRAFPKGDYPVQDRLLLELFARRAELAKIKGEHWSGKDIVETTLSVMSGGSKTLQAALVTAHPELTPEELGFACDAGRHCLTSATFYDTFSPYLLAKVDEKKKAKDPAWARREAVIDAIVSRSHYYYWWNETDDSSYGEERPKPPPYDPRWIDLAVALERQNLVLALAVPGHVGAQQFAKDQFETASKKAKSPDDLRDELILLLRLRHPDATDAFFAALGKKGKKSHFHPYWFAHLVPRLSKEALPRLEEMVATLPEIEANYWLDAIHELRTKV